MTGAFTPERVNVGVLGAKLWQRPEEPVAPERARKPIEEKESYRWLEGYALACEVQQPCPQTVVVSVADCEGDIPEWFLDTRGRAGEERAEVLIRAKCNRRLTPGAQHDYLGDKMVAARPLGKSTFMLSRQADRPPRRVTLTVTARPVTFKGARRPGGRLPPVEVWTVYAKELSLPRARPLVNGACSRVCRWQTSPGRAPSCSGIEQGGKSNFFPVCLNTAATSSG